MISSTIILRIFEKLFYLVYWFTKMYTLEVFTDFII